MRPSAIARTDAEVSIFQARYYCRDLAGLVRSIDIYCDEDVVDTLQCKRRGLEMCCVQPKFALKHDHHQPRVQVLKFVQNFLVEGLPWTNAYNWLFSGWRYLLLIAAAAALIIRSRGRQGTWALLKRYAWFAVFYALIAIPVLWSNRFYPGREIEGPIWTDAIRQKVFLEVPVYVALVYALWVTLDHRRKARTALQYLNHAP